MFKLDEDPIQRLVYFLYLMNSFKIDLSQFKKIYMLLIKYPSIRGEAFTDYAKKDTWNLLHTYINAHSQISIDEYPGYGVQAITIFQSQCENMTSADQRRYNRLFQKVIHKGW